MMKTLMYSIINFQGKNFDKLVIKIFGFLCTMLAPHTVCSLTMHATMEGHPMDSLINGNDEDIPCLVLQIIYDLVEIIVSQEQPLSSHPNITSTISIPGPTVSGMEIDMFVSCINHMIKGPK